METDSVIFYFPSLTPVLSTENKYKSCYLQSSIWFESYVSTEYDSQ